MTPRKRILPIFVPHLGCPHQCVFCNQRRITGNERAVTPEDVTALLDALPPGEAERTEAAFYGGSFTAIPPAAQEALLRAAQGRVAAIRVSTRPDAVDEETVARLRAFGVTTVELGAQSMSPRVLRAAGRGHTPEDTVRAAGLVRAGGLELMLQMMTGLPEDTPEEALRTARALAALRPAGVRIYPTVVLPGTELWELHERGRYEPQTLDQAVELCAELTEFFAGEGIPVIRCGLNPTAELDETPKAGPYHPAFGELVLGERYYRRERAVLSAASLTEGQTVVLEVANGRISAATGQKRRNALALEWEFGVTVRFREAGLRGEEVRLSPRDA